MVFLSVGLIKLEQPVNNNISIVWKCVLDVLAQNGLGVTNVLDFAINM